MFRKRILLPLLRWRKTQRLSVLLLTVRSRGIIVWRYHVIKSIYNYLTMEPKKPKKWSKFIIWILIGIVLIFGVFFLAMEVIINFIPSSLNGLKQSTKNSDLEKLPCPVASQVELGSPYFFSGKNSSASEFTTNGSTIYVYARNYSNGTSLGTLFDPTVVYIGNNFDVLSFISYPDVSKYAIQTVTFNKDKYSNGIQLPKGRYWLFSGSGDILIDSCDVDGVSDPKRVR